MEPRAVFEVKTFGEWNFEVQTMSSGREKEFDQYARECVRLAEGVDDSDLREKLLRQAREWMQAEMDEEDGADIEPLSG
jgi:DNA primase